MSSNQISVLDEHQIKQKIKRIAYEIYENNFKADEIVLAGIKNMGYVFAELLLEHLKQIAPFKISVLGVSLDKKSPQINEIELSPSSISLKNKTIVIVDDVLNSGKTMAHCVAALLKHHVENIQVAVLINRSHKAYPITPNYTGYELATTLQNHIEVVLSADAKAAYLH